MVAAPPILRHLRRGHVLHSWTKVTRDGWTFARCVRCGKERELTAERFVETIGEKPPPLFPSRR